MFGWRKRIGVITPTVIELQGYDFYKIAPEGIGLVGITCNIDDWKNSEFDKALETVAAGAEYLLRWLPRGTHDWNKFLRPSELAGQLRAQGLAVEEITGVLYNPLTASWRLGRDLDVNYMILARKA